jgi:hypothetical protein
MLSSFYPFSSPNSWQWFRLLGDRGWQGHSSPQESAASVEHGLFDHPVRLDAELIASDGSSPPDFA